jgi:hypothetical protein
MVLVESSRVLEVDRAAWGVDNKSRPVASTTSQFAGLELALEINFNAH